MTRLQARAILDAIRSGVDVPDALVTAAFEASDAVEDLPLYCAWRPAGTWERREVAKSRAGPFDGLLS